MTIDPAGARLLLAAMARDALRGADAIMEEARSILIRLDEDRDPALEPCPFCADWHNIGQCDDPAPDPL
jgi:hypothetical protein